MDRRNPSLIRVGTIANIEEFKVKIHFDGWDDIYDDWFDADSSDLHPMSWCEKSSHPLEAPISKFKFYAEFLEDILRTFGIYTHSNMLLD